MELNSVGSIEQELERCKASIRLLEVEVNKERFRMIYLQTLLAKERKSYDRQRWGFRRVSRRDDPPQQTPPHTQDQALGDWGKLQPAPARKHSYHGEGVEPPSGGEVLLHRELGETDGASPSKQRGGVPSSRRPPDKDAPPTDPSPKERPGMGLGVAALRSNFERIKRANSHSSGEGKVGLEYHHEQGVARGNDRDRDALDRTSTQMERKRSLHSLPGNLATIATATTAMTTGDLLLRRPVHRGRSVESHEDGDGPPPRFPRDTTVTARPNGGKQPHAPPPPWQPSDFPPYASVYIGGGGDGGGLAWARRAYSPGSLEDGVGGGGGGYTPDCSSNENLTSSEDDFSSGQSSRVSPSPTAYRGGAFPREEKSRSPSQNSHQSLDSSSPPTPQGQRRHRGASHPFVPGPEAGLPGGSSRKSVHVWAGEADRGLRDNSFHGDL
ncbi:hypothetical protein SKAU_G00279220, partial [Synaphobranchus kaupii]